MTGIDAYPGAPEPPSPADHQVQDGNGISPGLAEIMRQALEERGKLPGQKPPEPQPAFRPDLATDTEPAEVDNVGHELRGEMGEAVRPLKAEEFDIGLDGNFGWNLPKSYRIETEDGEIVDLPRGDWRQQQQEETIVRGWLEKAGMNAGETGRLKSAFSEAAQRGMTEETHERLRTQSMSNLVRQYGTRAGEALAAAQRFIDETGGEELNGFLRTTRLGSHPSVVETFVGKAIGKGYFKP